MAPPIDPAARLRVAVDATPLLGRTTGIGTFAEGLLSGLGHRSELTTVAYAVSGRASRNLPDRLPAGVTAIGRPMPAAVLHRVWTRFARPTAESLMGPVDVVHGTNFVVPPTSRAAAVVSVHDLTSVHFPEMCTPAVRRFPELVRAAISRGAWVHTDSQHVAAEVVDHFAADAERVVTVAPGIAVGGTGDVEAGRRLAGAPRFVLALGTIEPRKDLPGLVEAFDLLAAERRDLHLVIAGPDGWGADALATAVESAGHRDRIRRLGWVDDRGRADLLAAATVLAFPSLYEGFGFPPLEAMAAGTPVVATSAGSVPEVVGDGALLVPARQPVALAAGLARLLDDEQAAQGQVDAGRRRAATFTWDRCIEAMVDLYRRAADDR